MFRNTFLTAAKSPLWSVKTLCLDSTWWHVAPSAGQLSLADGALLPSEVFEKKIQKIPKNKEGT